MREITRARVFCCATRLPEPHLAEGRLAALTDDEFREWEGGLRQEVLRRLGGMMAALDPQGLALAECHDLFRLLRSFRDRRGGAA